MATAGLSELEEAPLPFIRFFHGTDLAGATDLVQNGVDQQKAAAWNASGEFWATTDATRAAWFARSHPNSPPAARFEFDLPDPILQAILHMNPMGARCHGPSDYEFLPSCFILLNQNMVNRQVVQIP